MLVESVQGHEVGDMELAARCANSLSKWYPGHQWRVFIDDDKTGGVMRIMNDTINEAVFANVPYGYTLHLKTIYHDPDLKCVMRAGGEILERARLARGRSSDHTIKRVDGVKEKHQPLVLVGA